MNLAYYYWKKVNIESVSNGTFSGFVNEYIEPEDNDSGKESIILKTEDGNLVEFEETDIRKIEVA